MMRLVDSWRASLLRRRRIRRRPTAACIVRTAILYLMLIGGAFWFGERYRASLQPGRVPLFWLEGEGFWAPDYGRCPTCGGELVPQMDVLSACRRCEHCQVSFRHPSLPKTLAEQEQVWK